MNRKEALKKTFTFGLCSGALFLGDFRRNGAFTVDNPEDEIRQLKMEKEFVQNWLADLLDTMDKELDLPSKVKLVEGCGQLPACQT